MKVCKNTQGRRAWSEIKLILTVSVQQIWLDHTQDNPFKNLCGGRNEANYSQLIKRGVFVFGIGIAAHVFQPTGTVPEDKKRLKR